MFSLSFYYKKTNFPLLSLSFRFFSHVRAYCVCEKKTVEGRE